MSGERQHFVPRFLLKGFASRTEGKDSYNWVFRPGSPPFETNIINVGVSREFYSLDWNTELDDIITKIEDNFAICVDQLRSHTSETELQSPKIPELVTHLLLRTKHLRDAFRRSTEYVFNALVPAIERPENLGKMILNYIKSHPEEFWRKIRTSFKGYHLSRKQRALLLNSIAKLAPALIREEHPQFMRFVDSFKQYIRENCAQVVKESHVKSLAKNLLPEARVGFARGLKWFLLINEPGSFILGDVAVVSKIGPDGRLKPLPDLSDDVVQIWLPISDRYLLAGAKDKQLIDRDVERINTGTVSLSHDFFVSSRNSEREKTYALALGSNSGLLTDEELQKSVAGALAELNG